MHNTFLRVSGMRESVKVKECQRFQPLNCGIAGCSLCMFASGLSSINKEDVCKMTLFRAIAGNNIALIFVKRKNGGNALKLYYPQNIMVTRYSESFCMSCSP